MPILGRRAKACSDGLQLFNVAAGRTLRVPKSKITVVSEGVGAHFA